MATRLTCSSTPELPRQYMVNNLFPQVLDGRAPILDQVLNSAHANLVASITSFTPDLSTPSLHFSGKKQAKLHNKSANGHTTPKPTTFDPRALLDPKHFPGNSPKQSNGIMSGASIQAEPEAVDLHSHGTSRIGNAAAVKASGQLEADSTLAAAPSVGALMENFLGVTQREARPQKRRKRDDGQGAEEQRKATFGGGGSNGGVLGQYMKEKRDEASKEAIHSGAIVDLTSGT